MFRTVATALVLMGFNALAVETVRISMGDPGRLSVSIQGTALSFGRDSEDAVFTHLDRTRATVSLEGDRLQLDGAPVMEGAVRIRAGEELVDAGIPGKGSLTVLGGMKVRGDVVVRIHRGALQLINVITLEDYLQAVLGSEMPASFPVEALKAQTVAARTYAVFKKLEAMDQPFHMGASVLDQVYGGVSRETSRTREAVEATRGEVLTFDLAPIEAYFHASCGGHTESGWEALSRDLPYLKSVSCPCGALPASHWSAVLKTSELGQGADGVTVVSRSSTGRARKVRVGPRRVIDAVTFRQRLGYSRVKSLKFETSMASDGSQVQLEGRGFGHGAGLCQWGAKALADQGWDYRKILLHYYAGAELQHLY